MFLKRPSLLTYLLVGAGTAQAEGIDLMPLEVTATRATSDWLQAPTAVSSISTADSPGEQMLTLDSLWR